MAVQEAGLAEMRARLRDDFELYAPSCLKIVNTDAELIPFRPKPAQLRINEVIDRQRREGRPMRVIVPKARKEGVSTYSVGKITQRVTQRSNHNAILVGNNSELAGELLSLAELMHHNLPESSLNIKPPIANRVRRKEMIFGNAARNSRQTGDMGLNSRLIVQPADEFEAGRGFTFHSVLGSEVAFWSDSRRKLTSLLNAVPDALDTLVILESTCNGHNHWRKLCYDAQEGLNDFELVFLPWFEEPQYRREFLGAQERGEFEESVGTGPYGVDEPGLIEHYGVTLEQLAWRRWAIANRCQGDLRIFRQEYPGNLDEAFGSTGRGVFNPDHVSLARKEIEAQAAPIEGTLETTRTKTWPAPYGTVEVPSDYRWTPTVGGLWRVWEEPLEDKQYIVSADVAGEEVADEDTAAHHAAVVIEQESGRQVAEMETMGDLDVYAEQLLLACLWFNKAWLSVEVTGQVGYPVIRRIHKDWRYMFIYKRHRVESAQFANSDDRMGFDTTRATRPVLIAGAVELLREGSHGIRSRALIRQFSTFVRDSKGKPVPAPGELSDLLMAWMIAQHVRGELPLRSKMKGGGAVSTTGRTARYASTGY